MTEGVLTSEGVIEFLNRFEKIAEQEDFELIQDMIHERAFFRFNDGDHVGRPAIRDVFEMTWQGRSGVKRERFYLSDIQVLTVDDRSATATYTYHWEGSMGNQTLHMRGRGTRVLVVVEGRMQIIHEHLSLFPQT
mgnify:CR=1 FL=1